MKCKVVRHRITIPAEIRNAANIQDGDYLDIEYDTKNNMIQIKLKQIELKQKKPAATNKKIEANFMDASNLYHQCFSECGLLVRTKNSYVRNACERCRGKLAEEWSDRAEIHCSYLDNDYINKVEKYKKDSKEPKLEKIRNQRKKNIKEISDKLKKAEDTINISIKELDFKPNISLDNVKIITKKRSKNNIVHTAETTINPVAFTNETVKCNDCGLYFTKGFYLDNDFLCKSCAMKDFERFLKKYRKENGDI